MGTLPALIGFQVPQMNLGDTYTAMARLAAYNQARRTSALELEEKRGRLDREALWRQTIAGALQPPAPVPGQGFAAAPMPQATALPTPGLPAGQGPGVAGGGFAAVEPTMPPLGVPVPVNTQTGQWGQPGGFTGAQPGMPAEITGMAQPTDTSQPPLQGGGFTAASPGTTTQPQASGVVAPQGFTAPQPVKPLAMNVPGLMPLPNADAVQRAFAIDPEKTSQWYTAYLTQRGKQLDEVKRNNQLVYQVSSAILEHPDYYQEGLDYLREQGVPVPKNMPPTMNAAQIAFYRDRSRDIDIGVKEAQMQNQQAQARLHREQAADVPVRTQLESTRLGLQGTTATMNDELRAMNKNPLTATAEDRQEAQRRIQQRELAKEGEAQRLKFEQEQRQQKTLPLQDARKEDAGLFVHKSTGETVRGTTPYAQVQTLQDDPDPTRGVVKLANLDEKKQLTTLKQLEPVLQQYADLVQYAYGTDPTTGKKGPLADYQRGPFQTIGAMWNQLAQDDPVFQAKRRALQGQLQSVVRGLGARGDLNAQELEAATQMLANMDASLGLGLSLGPMVGTGGFGVGGSIKPSISLPDTPETGINIANELIGTVNRRIGSLLQHEGYNKTPYIRIRTDQESEAKPGEMPRATPPPKPGPAPVPEPGPPIFPRPQIVIPGEGPTPRSAVPPPGRQSQAPPPAAPTRVAGFFGTPKVMTAADVSEAMAQTGRSRDEVEAAARARGYRVVPETQVAGWWDHRRSNGTVA